MEHVLASGKRLTRATLTTGNSSTQARGSFLNGAMSGAGGGRGKMSFRFRRSGEEGRVQKAEGN